MVHLPTETNDQRQNIEDYFPNSIEEDLGTMADFTNDNVVLTETTNNLLAAQRAIERINGRFFNKHGRGTFYEK